LQRILRKIEDVKRELKWKSDEEAAISSSNAPAGSADAAAAEHQQNVVRSCISRLRRGSDFKTTKTPARLHTRTTLGTNSSSVKEEHSQKRKAAALRNNRKPSSRVAQKLEEKGNVE